MIKSLLTILSLFLAEDTVINSKNSITQDETGYYLYFADTENQDALVLLDFISEDQDLLYDLIEELNASIIIPTSVPIIFSDCGVANAFYSSEEEAIYMCYELLVESYNIYSNYGMVEEDLSIAIANNVFSIMLHEIGHSLVDLLQLPITGREEDAVDQFSVISLLLFEELGQEALVDFAMFWGGLASQNENELQNMAFWGEHSLSSQRFYDILCMAYGADSQNNAHFVTNGVLPESRASRCETEFERISNAWVQLLEPHIRD